MADLKISQLTTATTPLAGTETLPIVQSGTTKKTTVSDVLAGTASSGTANAIVYLNSSKVMSSGSSITTPNGATLCVGSTSSSLTSGVGVKFNPAGYSNTAIASCVGQESTNNAETWHVYSTGASAYRFYVGYNGTVYATSTTISSISDQRLKENIRDLDEGLSKLLTLKPRKFDWKPGKGRDIKNDRGWIAQEFEQVFPEMIDNWKDETLEGVESYKSVRAELIPIIVKAVQELNATMILELQKLQERVADLESR